MSDSVKFIFKTLIKVPCYIMVAYFILNIFAFAYTYFKMLGLSYVVMQTAVENNYIPETEYQQLTNYINQQDTAFCDAPRILVNASGEPDYESGCVAAYGDTYSRRQYGSEVKVGVAYNFRMIWPLIPIEADEASTGHTDDGIDNWNNRVATIDNDKGWNTVVIKYTVPGLKYYPDLSS